jgi:hypothetical protein
VEISQNKAPSLCWEKAQISETPFRKASFDTKQLRRFEKSQHIYTPTMNKLRKNIGKQIPFTIASKK